jgi:Ca-activated chloride channel homolog
MEEYFLPQRMQRKQRHKKSSLSWVSSAKKIIFLSILVIFAAAGRGVSGDDLYARGRYDEAIVEYQRELSSEPDSPRLRTNLGCSLYRLGRYEDAMRELKTALNLKPEALQAARIHYNVGNCFFTTNRIDEAIESYKEALRLNPNDKFAKYNLEVALKQKDRSSPPPSSSKSQSQNSSGQSEQQPQQNDPDSASSRDDSKSQQSRMTRDEAERILDALSQSEKGPTHRGNTQRSYFNTTIKRDW